jgi:hypothetical protein
MSVRDPAMETWTSAIDEFPLCGSTHDKLAALVPFAVMAPSSHNSQPWLFRITDDALELWADQRRSLPVCDPENRELIISCGAALGCLETALHNFGYQGAIELVPSGHHPELLARIRLGEPRDVTDLDEALFAAIRTRRTHRLPFLPRSVDSYLLSDLESIAERNRTWFRILQAESSRMTLATLITEGDRAQMGDPAFRRELVSWIHPNRTRSRDGMPGWAFGFGAAKSVAAPLVVRTFDIGAGRAANDRELALGSPVLAILGTSTETPRDWVQTGRVLTHILLRAAVEGILASYLNQPIEVPALRQRVSALLGHWGFPHLILRMGYPVGEDRHTPRRALDEVLEHSSAHRLGVRS